jgi:hypothetical protein
MAIDSSFRVGDSIDITVSNRPYIDKSVPIESNDYRDVEHTNIKIYDPCGVLLVEDTMCPVDGRIGWYYFTYQTNEDCNKKGQHKVVVELGCYYPTCGAQTVCTTGSTGTSGTSGVGTTGSSGIGQEQINFVTTKKVQYFRLLGEDVV